MNKRQRKKRLQRLNRQFLMATNAVLSEGIAAGRIPDIGYVRDRRGNIAVRWADDRDVFRYVDGWPEALC